MFMTICPGGYRGVRNGGAMGVSADDSLPNGAHGFSAAIPPRFTLATASGADQTSGLVPAGPGTESQRVGLAGGNGVVRSAESLGVDGMTHRFAVSEADALRALPGVGVRRTLVSFRCVGARNLARAVKATRPGPLVLLFGGAD
jgi:hypothetical protein